MFGLEMTKTSTMDALYRRLRRAEAEREEYRTRCEEVLHGQGQSVNWLIRALDHEREVSRKLTDTLHGSEEQRRQLCRDCKWTKMDGTDDPAIYCEKWDRWEVPPEGFCHYGKKREESHADTANKKEVV